MTGEEGCRPVCGQGHTVLPLCSSTQVGIRLRPSCPVSLTSLRVAQVPASHPEISPGGHAALLKAEHP